MNIIRNGGFESGTLSPGWRQTPGSALLDGGITDAISYFGNYCLELRGADSVEQAFFLARADGNLTFRAKSVSGECGPFLVRVEYSDGSENVRFVEPSTDWEEFGYEMDNSKRLYRIQFTASESVCVYIDDVSLDGVSFYPARLDFHYSRNIAWRGFLYPYDQPWLMFQSEIMEEQAMFEYGSAIEDRLVQIETQLAQLTSMLSIKRDTGEKEGEPAQPKATANKSSRKTVSDKRKKAKKPDTL